MWPTPRHVATKGSVSTLLPNTPSSKFTKLPPHSPPILPSLPLRKTRVLSFSEKRVTACFLSRPQRGEVPFSWAHPRWWPSGLWILSFSTGVLNQLVLLPRVEKLFRGPHPVLSLFSKRAHTMMIMITSPEGPTSSIATCISGFFSL